jgi:TRAP-type C4-dicarboxylate transport system permease small subunit
MKKQLIASATALGLFSLVVLPTVVFAQDPISGGFNVAQNIGEGALGTADLRETIVSLVNVLLGFLGIIAVIIILWGGFQWMTAAGNEEKVGEARSLIIAGIIGLAIIIASFAIASFVIREFSGATNGTVSF